MRNMAWLAALLSVSLLSGCGGGGATSSGGGTVAPHDAGSSDYKPVAAARVDVNVETGAVVIEHLKHEPSGRAVWTGNTVELIASQLSASDGLLSQRSLNLSLKNNTNETIGVGNGVRLQIRDITSQFTGDFRTQVKVSTIAGNGVNASTDGPALANSAMPIALSPMPDGGIAFVEPLGVRVLRNGVLSTVGATLTGGTGLVVAQDESTGSVHAFVADGGAHRIRWVNMATGESTSFAGTGTAGDVLGSAATAQFNNPRGLAWDGSGIVVADSLNGKVKRIPVTFTGGIPSAGSVVDLVTGLSLPTAVALNGSTLAVTEESAHRVRLVRGNRSISLGSGTSGFTTGTGAAGRLSQPTALAYSQGVLFVVNGNLGSVSAIWANADSEPMDVDSYRIGQICGTGLAGFAEGVGNVAQFNTQATGILASGGRIVIGDRNNRRIRAIDSVGISLSGGYGEFDGAGAKTATVVNPTGRFGVDSGKSVPYIVKQVTLAPRATTPFGRVDFTLDAGLKRFMFYVVVEASASSPGFPDSVVNASPGPGSSGTFVQLLTAQTPRPLDGPIGSAGLGNIWGLDADAQGNLYIAEQQQVRRYNALTQQVSTIAGFWQSPGATVDGAGNLARFSGITGIAVTPSGESIYVIQDNHVVRVIQYMGVGSRDERSRYTTATIIGLAGTAGNAFGIGTAARINSPTSISFGPDGMLGVMVDSGPSRVWGITYTGVGDSSSGRLNQANYIINSDSTAIPGTHTQVDFDRSGGTYNFIVLDGTNPSLRSYDKARFSTTTLVFPGAMDIDGALSQASTLFDLASDSAGNVWYLSHSSPFLPGLKLRRVSREPFSSTVAGGGPNSPSSARGDEISLGSATRASIATAPNGSVYFSTSSGLYMASRIMR